MNKLSLVLASDPDDLIKAESFVEEIIAKFYIPEKLRLRLSLAVVEAVTNSLLFRQKNNPRQTIKIHAIKYSQQLVVTLEEEGGGIDFGDLPLYHTPDELLAVAGRGIYVMLSLPDELLFSQNGAKVCMTFRLGCSSRQSV